jgi:nucleotide-binding universal stress UspA family protein
MKTVLALIGGGARDEVILHTALAAARPFAAHLHCLHMRVGSGEAARYSNTEFARGPALRNALSQLESKAITFSGLAAEHVRDFCARSNIEICDTPPKTPAITASYHEEQENPVERLIFHARHCDLVVMGRSKQKQGLPPDILERLLLSCGRPMLVAASVAPQQVTGTVMVCWKESGHAARAVAAATPILAKAQRVVIAAVMERGEDVTESVQSLARQFAWNGIAAEVQVIPANGRKIPDVLAAAAERCGADILVTGAFSHSRTHQLLFGSCTEAFLHHADKPILLMH